MLFGFDRQLQDIALIYVWLKLGELLLQAAHVGLFYAAAAKLIQKNTHGKDCDGSKKRKSTNIDEGNFGLPLSVFIGKQEVRRMGLAGKGHPQSRCQSDHF